MTDGPAGSTCFICKKQASGDALGCGVVYEDDIVFASHMPPAKFSDAYLGYVFVETKRHVAGLGELSDAEATAVGALVNDVAFALRVSEGADHVYSYVYGDGVPHFHVHLQARYPNTPREYLPKRSGKAAITVSLTEWPDAPRGEMESVRQVSSRLRQVIETRRATAT